MSYQCQCSAVVDSYLSLDSTKRWSKPFKQKWDSTGEATVKGPNAHLCGIKSVLADVHFVVL